MQSKHLQHVIPMNGMVALILLVGIIFIVQSALMVAIVLLRCI